MVLAVEKCTFHKEGNTFRDEPLQTELILFGPELSDKVFLLLLIFQLFGWEQGAAAACAGQGFMGWLADHVFDGSGFVLCLTAVLFMKHRIVKVLRS